MTSGAEVSDEAAIRLTLSGDSAAFGLLVHRYWPTAVALALARMKEPSHAEDAAQESFLKAYAALNTLRDHARFAGWLTKIVAQQCADIQRMKARRPVVHMGACAADWPDPRGNGNPRGISDTMRKLVQGAVAALPEKYRNVVLLRFVTGLSTEAIARQLGIRHGAARVRLHRAYEKLRRELAPVILEVREP